VMFSDIPERMRKVSLPETDDLLKGCTCRLVVK
jgi:hypothetical protein